MNKIEYFIRKNSPIILTAVSIGGVILTTVSAVKATPKAIELLKKAEEEKGEELTLVEKVKYGWKPFIFTGIYGMSTILCIVSTQYINSKKQASIVSAYTLLNNAFSDYRANVKRLYTDEGDLLARQEIVRAKYDQCYEPNLELGEELFFDYQGMRFFTSTMEHVMQAECEFKNSVINKGYGCLNEYYDCLGIPYLDYGYQLGWADIESCDPYNVRELEFNYQKVIIGEDGSHPVECWIISPNIPASFDYIV